MSQANSETRTILCPYCGHMQNGGDKCDLCGGLFEPLSRKATQIAMGPWFLRDSRMPFRPGCSYEVIKKQAKAGRIKPATVLRGPTTKQFWSVARNVPGIAHLIGYCHDCGEKVDPASTTCRHCGTAFSEPDERNELGLMYMTEAEASRAQRRLNAAIARANGEGGEEDEAGGGKLDKTGAATGGDSPSKPAAKGGVGMDLLADVLGDEVDMAGGTPETPGSAPTGSTVAPGAGRTAAPQAARSAAALDFGPTDDVNDLESAESLAEGNSRLGALTWVLVGINVLILVAVIYMFSVVASRSNEGKEKDGDSKTNQPGDDSGVMRKPIVVEPYVLAADDPIQQTLDREPGRTPAQIAADLAALENTVLDQSERDRLEHNRVAAALNVAETLRKNGDLRGALAKLVWIRDDIDRQYHPRELSKWIDQTRASLNPTGGGSGNVTFFGLGEN